MQRCWFVMGFILLVNILVLSPWPEGAADPGGIPEQLQTLEHKIDALQGTLNSLQSAVNTLQNTVNTLQSTVNAQQNILNGFAGNGVPMKPQRYYVSQNTADGSQARSACAAGFHMANLFEFITLGSLQYDTALGMTRADSGNGPPTFYSGWVRTGFVAGAEATGFAGKVNCQAWSSNASTDVGTVVELNATWLIFFHDVSDNPFREAPWLSPGRVSCDTLFPVWCIEDRRFPGR